MTAATANVTAEQGVTPEPVAEGALARHQRLRQAFHDEGLRHDGTVGRISLVQLLLFGGAAVLGLPGIFRGDSLLLWGGAAVFALFLVVRAVQARFLARRDRAWTRRDIHERHVARATGRLDDLPSNADDLLPPAHPYAADLDLVGSGSVVQRIDVTHTRDGAGTLVAWLSEPARAETIRERQAAVRELADGVELRQELEASVLDTGREHLDPRPFLELMGRPGVHERRPWLRYVSPLLPVVTLTLLVLGQLDLVHPYFWLVPLAGQIAIVWATDKDSAVVFEALGSRRGFVEAFRNLFRVAETMEVQAPALRRIQERLRIEGASPSVQLGRLDRWVGFYELRSQGMAHFFVNPLLLWDLNCLLGIERWIEHVGRRCGAWFAALGELEALASLSVLLDQDLRATLPEVVDGGAFEAEDIAHPLLPAVSRVPNDVHLPAPGSCLIVTGSNMAGKSTLLRAVGTNIALALAGGPVIARRLRVPRVRLRASMRVADSLQKGASYFQAELLRLRLVVDRADAAPPVFFLLDELLRGTNARARHIGARAVVTHLLARGAMGLVATHDVALSAMEEEGVVGEVRNVHFTDVIDNGVMTFDYRLRPGVVRTSNALRLLAEVGIEVEDDPVLFEAANDAAEGASGLSSP
ncbi:MAG: DNA mismatch repair protein MutS [Sandaracinaceae bacterium]